jgi:hypothetical protein
MFGLVPGAQIPSMLGEISHLLCFPIHQNDQQMVGKYHIYVNLQEGK